VNEGEAVSVETRTAPTGAAPAVDAAHGAPPSIIWELLRVPFPVEKIGKLPRATVKADEYKALPKVRCLDCGGFHPAEHTIHLDFVGHADVTDRLLSVDPEWNWEPVASDQDGLPLFTRSEDGRPVGLWIRLTVGGVTRLGYGSVEGGAFDAEKQLIGDALRNAAMRFGVALDLWRKEVHPEANGGGESAPAAVVPCPKCDGHLKQRQSKRGSFLSCSSWKSRENPGCGFTADGTLAEWAEKERELADSTTTTAPPPEDRGAVVAAGKCPECQRRLLTTKTGKAVTFYVPSGGDVPVCNGYDPVAGEWPKHLMAVEEQA
jgi:ssDNA-binding Zn-finger/Zn-ribbon topoisomerase 1